MSTLAAVVIGEESPIHRGALESLLGCAELDPVALVAAPGETLPTDRLQVIRAAEPRSSATIQAILDWFAATQADDLLWVLSRSFWLAPEGLRRLRSAAADLDAVMVYADCLDGDRDGRLNPHPLIDYQVGSLRDDFDFGPAVWLRGKELRAWRQTSESAKGHARWGGWYDLRLRLSEQGPVVRLPEPIGVVHRALDASGEAAHFSYVDPRNREYQLEMERLATDHLRRIGACLPPPRAPLCEEAGRFPVEASVVIPVRNRERTIADAVRSALTQVAEFPFNVIVVDNHSTDGTTRIVAELAAGDPRCVPLVPTRTDLGIGGCWNEAIYSQHCGRIAVQLDSDDLYSHAGVLRRIVAAFYEAPVAMVIGSYTIVDFDLQPIPPGLVDHREWTDDNGHNNALRIAGLGAPRAFHVPTLRTIGFPNVSYGEDYAVALQLTRRYPIGRIYESLYWCRRWEDNTDHALSLETRNRYASYKDRLRTIEIASRQS